MTSKRVLRLTGALALAVAFSAAPAFAQGTAVMTGTVTDASTQQPVADVVVTATSPNLQGEQVVVTDASGQYRIPQLPGGVYTLRLEKEQYKPYSRGGITLRLDQTVRVNVQILPEALQGGVEEVIGKAPTIDIGSTSTGVSVGSDFIKNIAVVRPGGKGSASRSFESLAELAPGASGDQYGVSISGATSPENQYIVDGVSVNDPGFGLVGTGLSIEFLQEVNVISGGYLPEFGRSTGGVVNAVTKSGSNEFHGSVWGNWAPGALEGNKKEIIRAEGTVSGVSKLWNLGDFGAELGGPIIKDKLWFYAGIAPSFQRNRVERNLNRTIYAADGSPAVDAEGNIQTERLAGTQQFLFADQRSIQYIGKLTYVINQDNNIALTVLGTPTTSGGEGKLSIDPRSGGVSTVLNGATGFYQTLDRSGGTDVSLKYSSAFMDKRLLFDVTGGWHHQADSSHPVDDSAPGSMQGIAAVPAVRYRDYLNITQFENLSPQNQALCAPQTIAGEEVLPCGVSNYTVGGPGFVNDSSLDRYQGKAIGTLLLNALGHHVIKAGVDVEVMRYDQKKAYTGGVFWRDNGGGTFQTFRRYGFLTGPDTDPNNIVGQDFQRSLSTSQAVGGFIQDSWNLLDVVTVNAGVRYDQQALIGGDDRTAIFLPNQWSPRIGLIYDFTREGRSKVFASYARYFEQIPLDMVDRQFPGERQLVSSTTCDPTTQSNCLDPSQQLLGTRGATDPNRFYSVTGGVPSTVDANLKPQSSDEFVAGLEYELFSNARVGASYTKRYMVNVIEDMSRDDGNTYFIGNPSMGIANDFPKATRDYDAVTVYFNKNFSDLWLAQVSYTWSDLRGNYPGLFRPETGQLDPNINADFDLISLLPNRTGPLPGDYTHAIKAFVAKEFVIGQNFSTNLGLSYRTASGAPISALVGHPIYGDDEGFLIPRGAAGRLPWTHRIDGTLGLNYKLSKDNIVTASVDVFNIFNFQQYDLVDETFTTSAVKPLTPDDCGGHECTLADVRFGPDGNVVDAADPTAHLDEDIKERNFGKPARYQAPRSVRFGIKVTF